VIIDADVWLTSIFGYAVFNVSLPVPTEAATLLTSETVFREAKPAFYYSKLPTERVGDVSALTRLGFSVVDVSVTLERRGSALTGKPIRNVVAVRESRPTERADILEIAESCFVYSRFHLDPQIPNEVANAVKRAWVDNYCKRQRGDRLFVAEIDGTPVGFLAAIRRMVGKQRAWIIDLVGVHRDYQRRSVGRALVDCFVRESHADADMLKVGTQAANVPSIALYEKCGFRVAETAYVLHAHVQAPLGQV